MIRDGAVTELIEYQQSLFVDAKLVGNNIAQPVKFSTSYSNYQLAGFIDVLSNFSPAGLSLRGDIIRAGLPILAIISSREGRVQPKLVGFANENKVSIFQNIACNNDGGTLGVDDLKIGKSIVLNPELTVSLGGIPAEPLDLELSNTPAGTLPATAEAGVGN